MKKHLLYRKRCSVGYIDNKECSRVRYDRGVNAT